MCVCVCSCLHTCIPGMLHCSVMHKVHLNKPTFGFPHVQNLLTNTVNKDHNTAQYSYFVLL